MCAQFDETVMPEVRMPLLGKLGEKCSHVLMCRLRRNDEDFFPWQLALSCLTAISWHRNFVTIAESISADLPMTRGYCSVTACKEQIHMWSAFHPFQRNPSNHGWDDLSLFHVSLSLPNYFSLIKTSRVFYIADCGSVAACAWLLFRWIPDASPSTCYSTMRSWSEVEVTWFRYCSTQINANFFDVRLPDHSIYADSMSIARTPISRSLQWLTYGCVAVPFLLPSAKSA